MFLLSEEETLPAAQAYCSTTVGRFMVTWYSANYILYQKRKDKADSNVEKVSGSQFGN